MLKVPVGSLAGKIAVVTQATPLGGYHKTNIIRTQGPTEAARRGAVAYLLRSLTDASNRIPHTGAVNYADKAARIPAAVLSVPDAEQIERLVARGKTVRIRLNLQSISFPALSWNIVGEIPGRSVDAVLMGAHLDSWDVGTGASDDGAGAAIAIAAARLAGESSLKRTIRVVLFGGEEIAIAGPAYVTDSTRVHTVAVAGEADAGSEPAIAVSLPPNLVKAPPLGLSAALAPLRVRLSKDAASDGSPDTGPLHAMGVPAMAVQQDTKLYLHWHHTEDDTLDKIVPSQLQQNVATWAMLLRSLATSDIPLGTGPAK